MPSPCPRCAANPTVSIDNGPGTARDCAFATPDGSFTPDNWNCATLSALGDNDSNSSAELYGEDETLKAIYGPEGWIVLTRYKRRGCCSSAILCGDFWPPKPLTLEMAERWLAALKAKGGEAH